MFTGDRLPSIVAACSLDPFALWTAFRPPWWRLTATTTTGPPPRPDGNSGRYACPKPTGSAGTAGTLPVHSQTGRQGRCPAVPRRQRHALPQPRAWPRRPINKRTSETALNRPLPRRPKLLEHIDTELRRERVAPEQIIFKITETAALTSVTKARAFGEHLSEIGLSSRFGGDSSVRKRDLDAGAAEVDHRDQGVGGVESVCVV